MHEQKQQEELDGINTLSDYVGEYINGNGGGTTEPEDPTKDWNLDKVDKVTSDDNIVVPVPKGYVKSTIPGEKSVSTGFVIKEGDNGAATEGVNEFVWVPVPEISDIYDEANKAGQLWDFGTKSSPKNPAEKRTYPTILNDGYREPDVVTYADSGQDSASGSKSDADLNNLKRAGFDTENMENDLNSDGKVNAYDFKKQLQNEFNRMIESVRVYKGFYIGRYETGNLSSTTKAVVQKNNSDIGSQAWYIQYKLSKTIGANENVKSSMIWGCQWDATLRWMQTSKNEEVKNFPINSKGKGNYAGTQGSTNKAIPTGSNPTYAVNNIYDMAGNVYDWTLESNLTNARIRRGDYYGNGSFYTASSRDNCGPNDSGVYNGSRSTLYVALSKLDGN